MSSEWVDVTLGEFAEINPKRPVSKGAIAKFIEMAALPTNARDIQQTDIVDREFKSGGAKFRNGDTLLARITPCLENGKTALVSGLGEGECAFGSTEFIVLGAKNEDDQRFLYYLARSEEFRAYAIARMEGTSGRQRVPNAAVAEYRFNCPPQYLRKEIGKILGSLDDRIALLRETNATLEAIAQALFKSWFVDFDPVHANAAFLENGQAPSLPAEIQALFPSRLVESPQGLIPEGWEWGAISDYAILNPESWTAKKHPETVAYIDLANAKNNVIADIAEFVFADAPSRARRVLKDRDTIVGTVRPGNRSFAFIYDAVSNLTGSTGFAVLRPKHLRNTAFIYLAATNDNSIDHLTHVADGGAYPAVRPDVVAGLTCVCAPTNVLEAFNEVSEELLCKISKNHSLAQTLSDLRDTLLPRLISGQLRLPEAETALAEVG